jgi:type 2 lantibiotic biosynthesis protein LanM
LNERGAQPRFPTLTALDRGAYGWVEHVSARACTTVEEVRRFYRRQGGYLALLYLIDATDFHSGNLIACGEHPFLIDLEALFHPHRTNPVINGADPASRRAEHALTHSLLSLGLLPKRSQGNSEHAGVDRSGLGTVEGQITPYTRPRWVGEGTDTLHLARERVPVWTQKNRPQLGETALDVRDYEAELQEGFAATYELLSTQRTALQADDSPLRRFANDEVCVFLRSMRTYRRLLDESYHPDVLRDALDRERLLDALWVQAANDAELAKVIQAERDELLRNDVPQFTARPASPDLWSANGERLPNFFAEASLTTVQRRLTQLSRADYERQSWFIRASLATLPGEETREPAPSESTPGAAVTPAELLAAAQALGDRLAQLSLRGPDDAAWLGLIQMREQSWEPEQSWEIDALGLDLDSGLPGVALFLAYLGAVAGQERFTALAQAALRALQRQIVERRDEVTMIGGFDGWGGVLYTLTHLAALWRRPDLLAEAAALVERLPALIEEDSELDVYGGAAGSLGALRCLAQLTPSARVTEVALHCGAHLLARAEPTPAPGFLRGTAGLAWAFWTLREWTGQERFHAAARAFGRQTLNDAATVDSVLAQFSLAPFLNSAELRARLAAALETCLPRASGRDHSLERGAAGCLELLLQAQRLLDARRWRLQLRRFSAALLASAREHGWRCGTPRAVETPGLLRGLAGIGWQLLRLAEPERVPSVLLLEPPPAQHRKW